jgi:GH25 family lysozyme M1 (1,4-beta-N-acetylmuramidase)
MKKILLCIILLVGVGFIFLKFRHKEYGIDLSHHNKLTNKEWAYLLEKKKVSFVILKASEGKSFKDPMFNNYYAIAKKYNLKIGAYHFYRDDISPMDQFNNFQNAIKGKHLDIIPVIDFEPKGFSIKYSKYDRLENLRLLIKLFENHYKVNPIIYCSSIDYYVSYRELRYLSNLFWINNFKSYLVYNNSHINQYKINLFKKELDFNEVSNINKYTL